MELYEAQDYVLRRLKLMGAVDVTVSASKSNANQQKFVDNEVIMTKNWVDEAISVFIAIGNRGQMRTGSTSVPFETKEKVDKRLHKLINFVKLTPPNQYYYALPKKSKYTKVNGIYDKSLLNWQHENTDMLVESINQALDAGAKRCSGAFDYSIGEDRLLTSTGVDIAEKSTSVTLSIRAFVDSLSSSHKVAAASNLNDFNPFYIAKRAGEIAVEASKVEPVSIKPGKYNVLFDPLPFAVLINNVGESAGMFNVETESSFFGGKLNKSVAAPIFNLYDQGNLPGGLGSGAYDDEGTPTQKTEVVSKGTLKNYLHSTSTAHRHKTKSTGNAGIISPSPTNLIVAPGKTAPNKLLSELKNGLYVTNIWYTRFQNYKTGDFSTIPRDAVFLVKNGEIKGLASGMRISDNMIRMLKNIKSLGNKNTVQRILGWEADTPSEVPSAVIKNVNITRPESK